MATTTYKRTKHTRANGTVYYTYPSAASRRYWESKTKKTSSSSKSGTTTYRRTKHTRANGSVYYTYPNTASRKYWESRTKKTSSKSSHTHTKKKTTSTRKPSTRRPTSRKPTAKPNNSSPTTPRYHDSGSGTYVPPQTFNRKFNLENDLPLAQGSQHPWAQPTSISSMITGLLADSRNSSLDAWQAWAQSKPGQTSASLRSSSPYGVNVSYTDAAMTNPLGAFASVGEQQEVGKGSFGGWVNTQQNPVIQFVNKAEEDEWRTKDLTGWNQAYINASNVYKSTHNYDERNKAFMESYATFFNENKPEGTREMFYNPETKVTDFRTTASTPNPNPSPSPNNPGGSVTPTAPQPLPGYDTTGGGVVPGDINPEGSGVFGVYNPWARGEGGEYNAFGPSPGYMAQATMESMALANAYFAPQRMELAYELGDMETDMRRLSVNLGRQVDDPVLQAKLYKEAARSVRTLDVQQNTFAFQMAEQRRREEMQNFQYYDQLAQEEYRLRLANRQYYDDLELRRRYYNLQNWNVSATAGAISNLPAANTPQQEQNNSNFLNGGARNYVTDSPYNTNSLYNAGNLLRI